MAGKVYITNVSASLADYTVNYSHVSMTGRPIDPSTYTPYFTFASRAKFPDDRAATFAFGENAFSVSYADTIPPEAPGTDYRICIPLDLSIDDDLILYVYRNGVLLMTTRGVALPPNKEFIPNET